jgi:cAMP-dependent protein kinase regulator|tara:strand:+ start:276 stop:410 length:135 start_codon:yes stop_codon:yes gene_type:complete
VFGQFNKKEDFEPKIIQKSEAVKQAIMDKIQQAFMFSGLDETEK